MFHGALKSESNCHGWYQWRYGSKIVFHKVARRHWIGLTLAARNLNNAIGDRTENRVHHVGHWWARKGDKFLDSWYLIFEKCGCSHRHWWTITYSKRRHSSPCADVQRNVQRRFAAGSHHGADYHKLSPAPMERSGIGEKDEQIAAPVCIRSLNGSWFLVFDLCRNLISLSIDLNPIQRFVPHSHRNS